MEPDHHHHHESIWKSSEGDKFAQMNPTTAEATDDDTVSYLGVKMSTIFNDILKVLKADGDMKFDCETAKVLDIGCSTGGKLHVMEKAGFKDSNLFGVDMSPKAIAILKEAHPKYHAKVISSCDYQFDDIESFDIVYHTSVSCQISPANMVNFFDEIRKVKPKFYFFLEGQSMDDEHHKVTDMKVPTHPLGKESEEKVHIGDHHAHNFPDLVRTYLPEAKELFKKELNFSKEVEDHFKSAKMRGCIVVAYQLTL